MRIRRRVTPTLAIVLVMVLSFTAACHRKVTVANTPVGVSSQTVANWYTAVGAFKIAAQNTQKLTDAAINMHKQFPDEATYQKTLEALGRMAQIEAQAGLFLDTVPENWNQSIGVQVQNYANELSKQAGIAIDDGIAHVKNPTTAAAIQITINLIRGAIQTAVALTT